MSLVITEWVSMCSYHSRAILKFKASEAYSELMGYLYKQDELEPSDDGPNIFIVCKMYFILEFVF
jgi:hypothetical protein